MNADTYHSTVRPALLARADSTTFQQEAESCRRKVSELDAKYGDPPAKPIMAEFDNWLVDFARQQTAPGVHFSEGYSYGDSVNPADLRRGSAGGL